MNHNVDESLYQSNYGQEYAITLQFQLQRQKQKNKILEQRLRNKQIFIVQMKKMQSEMQLLNEKCRIQLQESRQAKSILQNVTLRQYAQTIAQLQHKIGLLENSQSGYYKEIFDKKIPKNKSNGKLQKLKPERFQKQMDKQKQQQSQLLKKFTKRFLQMYFLYSNQSNQTSLKKKLKSGWKWIKVIVQQWEHQQKIIDSIVTYAQECKENQQNGDPQELLNLINQKKEHIYQNDN